MARRASAKAAPVEPATPREARAYLLENPVEGVTVGVRGRLSAAALAAFTEKTGRPVVSPAASAE